MKMRGRGFSSCLICENEQHLLLGSELVLSIINARYQTNIFDIMLQNTKVCAECIGQLEQLDEFLEKNKQLAQMDNCYKEDKKICDMYQNEFSSLKIVPSIKSFIDPENLKSEGDKSLLNCFSSYNFVLLFNKTKEQLTELLSYFNFAINNCSVNISKSDVNKTKNYKIHEVKHHFLKKNHQKRVSFSPHVEYILHPLSEEFRRSQTFSLNTRERATPKNEDTTKSIKRKLRYSDGDIDVIKSRKISSSDDTLSDLNFSPLKKKFKIRECIVLLERLKESFPNLEKLKKEEEEENQLEIAEHSNKIKNVEDNNNKISPTKRGNESKVHSTQATRKRTPKLTKSSNFPKIKKVISKYKSSITCGTRKGIVTKISHKKDSLDVTAIENNTIEHLTSPEG